MTDVAQFVQICVCRLACLSMLSVRSRSSTISITLRWIVSNRFSVSCFYSSGEKKPTLVPCSKKRPRAYFLPNKWYRDVRITFKCTQSFTIDVSFTRRFSMIHPCARALEFQIDNACATQAIINCLLNRPDIDVGPDLGAFREFTSALPAEVWHRIALHFCAKVFVSLWVFSLPVFITCLRLWCGILLQMRGLALDEVKRVRTAHNSYARCASRCFCARFACAWWRPRA
jgi:hypothetical protein